MARKAKDVSIVVAHDGSDVPEKQSPKIKVDMSSLGSSPKTRIRAMVRGAYQMQKVRIQLGNRIAAAFRKNLGLESSQREEEEAIAARILKELRTNYNKIMDGIDMPTARKFRKERMAVGLIQDYADLLLMDAYVQQEAEEEKMFYKSIPNVLSDFPIYTEFLSQIDGVGPAMAAVIISEIDISKATYPASLWKYCGLDVVITNNRGEADGRGRGRFNEHLVPKTIEGTEDMYMGLSFKPLIKTKLTGVLGSSFLRSTKTLVDNVKVSSKDRLSMAVDKGFVAKGIAPNKLNAEVLDFLRNAGHFVTVNYSKYGEVYHNYKFRQIQINNLKPEDQRITDSHIHNRCIRYMVKRFLVDLYNAWRPLEGLPVMPEYAVAKLGIEHGQPSWGKLSPQHVRL